MVARGHMVCVHLAVSSQAQSKGSKSLCVRPGPAHSSTARGPRGGASRAQPSTPLGLASPLASLAAAPLPCLGTDHKPESGVATVGLTTMLVRTIGLLQM